MHLVYNIDFGVFRKDGTAFLGLMQNQALSFFLIHMDEIAKWECVIKPRDEIILSVLPQAKWIRAVFDLQK